MLIMTGSERIDPRSLYVICSMMGKVDLREIAAAKARLEAAGKEVSDECHRGGDPPDARRKASSRVESLAAGLPSLCSRSAC